MNISLDPRTVRPAPPVVAALRSADDYRSGLNPVWCPGCGHYSVLNGITEALAMLQLPNEQVALISGIGCSSRIPAYARVYGFHGLHGRALPVATALALTRPDLTVLVAGGDGDGLSIGGNHFLHACRRNVHMTYVLMDNQVYGMTKGQASPTSAPDWCGSDLTPQGTGISAFEPLKIALAAGANYVARCFSGDPANLADVLVEAIHHPGFSIVQVLSPCTTFRPEQRQWKDTVHPWPDTGGSDDDLRTAFRLVEEDDGFGYGRAIYKGSRPAFVLPRANRVADAAEGARIEEEFEL